MAVRKKRKVILRSLILVASLSFSGSFTRISKNARKYHFVAFVNNNGDTCPRDIPLVH